MYYQTFLNIFRRFEYMPESKDNTKKSIPMTVTFIETLFNRLGKMKLRKGIGEQEYIRTALDEKLTKDGF